MSGNDEKVIIPLCPNCKENTIAWVAYSKYGAQAIIFLDRDYAEKYGEFDIGLCAEELNDRYEIKKRINQILLRTVYIKCDKCHFSNNKRYLQRCLHALEYDIRRYERTQADYSEWRETEEK